MTLCYPACTGVFATPFKSEEPLKVRSLYGNKVSAKRLQSVCKAFAERLQSGCNVSQCGTSAKAAHKELIRRYMAIDLRTTPPI